MTSDAGTDRTISLEVDGVVVRKRFEADTFAVPTITFEIRSERDEPVELRLIDSIPSDFPMDGVGFHPDFGSEYWTAYQNNRVVFERQLEPAAEVKTVYGIRISDPSEGIDFLESPDVTVTTEDQPAVDTTGDLGESLDDTNVSDLVGAETSNLIREFIRGERSILPGIDFNAQPDDESDEHPIDAIDLDEDELEGLTADIEEADSPSDEELATHPPDSTEDADHIDEDVIPIFEEPDDELIVDPAESTADSIDDSSGNTDGEPESTTATITGEDTAMEQSEQHDPTADTPDDRTNQIAAALAAEIESGTVDDATVTTIARAIGRGVPTSVQTQLQHLQARVGELEAYSDAFARFLDEEGTGQQIVETMRADIEEIRTDVRHLDETLTSTEGRVEVTEERVATLAGDVESVEGSLESVAGKLDALADRHAEDLDRLEATLDDLETDVADEIDDVTDDLDEVASELDSVGDDVRDILNWRNQLGAMFSGNTKDDQ